MKAKLILYTDIWGNEEDGYWVNNAYNAGDVDLPENYTEEDLIYILKEKGFLKETVTRDELYFDYNSADSIEIFREKDYMPICRIELDVYEVY